MSCIYINKKAISVRNGFIIDLGAWVVLSRFLLLWSFWCSWGILESWQSAALQKQRERSCLAPRFRAVKTQTIRSTKIKIWRAENQYEQWRHQNGAQPLHLVRLVRKCPNIPATCSNAYYLYVVPTGKPKVCYFELLACSLPMKGFLSSGALEIPNHQQVISPCRFNDGLLRKALFAKMMSS